MKLVSICGTVAAAAACLSPLKSWAACTPTGFMRDNLNLTAALIDPTAPVTGNVDATGCNIGIYYDSSAPHINSVNGATVHGANYFGIVNNGTTVNIVNSDVYDIGETPISGNQLWNYQKAGIVVNGATASASIAGNTVIGQGPVDYIAQNGIEVGYGARATVSSNVVVGHSYTGPNFASSGGIILFGGPCYGPPNNATVNDAVASNIAVGNDVGVWFSNLAADCVHAVSTPTRDTASSNLLRDNAVTNTTGLDGSTPYQAGVSDQGDADAILNNTICGTGYANKPPHTYAIDISSTHNPTVLHNSTCSASTQAGANTAEAAEAATAPAPNVYR